MNKRIYMDYSATTPMREEVLEEMMEFMKTEYGNPSSIHSFGRDSKNAVDTARDRIAKTINAKSREIYFTGGGSEADNWAIIGYAFANKNKGNHIITTKIEHHAVLHTVEYLVKEHGFTATYLDVDADGLIDLEELKNAVTDQTILITVMFANNEIGTIQPIKEIGAIAKEKNVAFHTDGVQALGNLKLDMDELNIDMMSMSAHKLHGPKGIGALYIRSGLKIHNLIHGGAQERKKRAGTENVPGIVGFGKAAELADESLDQRIAEKTRLRDKMIDKILETVPYTQLNGHRTRRLPNNTNISFRFIEGESLLLSLDMVGIAASSGSACTSGSLDPSHVLLSLGLTHEVAHGSLRLTIGAYTTEEEVDYVLEQLPPIVERLRQMSPLYEEIQGGNQ